MNPNATLHEILILLVARDTEAAREKMDTLCEWIDRKGFTPDLADKICVDIEARRYV